MNNPVPISLERVKKTDVAICPSCGVLFVKPVKGISGGLLFNKGYYCPVCNELVCKENEYEE